MPDLDHCHYNFVPLPLHIVEPDWQARVSQDLPLEDGLCAEIDIELEAHTPLLVGGQRQGQEVHFFTLPNGTKAVPGSSVRGMVRAVLELASFSRIGMVQDRQLALRSPNNPQYRDRFVNRLQIGFGSKALTGWLRFDGRKWQVHPCRHARIEQRTLNAALGMDLCQDWDGANDSHLLPQWKYEKLRPVLPELRLFAGPIDPAHVDARAGRPVTLVYPRCSSVAQVASASHAQEVRLVVTGQVNRDKHREFLFSAATGNALEVPPVVWRAFLEIHEAAGRGGENAYSWLKSHRPFGALGMPVFYLTDAQGNLQHLGLCQMFKLPYPSRLHGYMGVHGQKTAAPPRLDFVQTLFGTDTWPDADHAGGLKSRVSFGDLRAVGELKDAPDAFLSSTVLATPKPTFHPTYFSGLPSLMPTTAGQQPSQWISGVKRYPAHEPQDVKQVPKAAAEQHAVSSKLTPVDRGSTFRGRVRFQNVRPEELGGVLWALLWGGDPRCRHALGMGRPFGLGQVSVEVTAIDLRMNDPARAASAKETDTEECTRDFIGRFTTFMQGQVPHWDRSTTLKELLAMARPGSLPSARLQPMRFKMQAADDEFRRALKGSSRLLPHTARMDAKN